MKKEINVHDKLIELLLKKAEGFHYVEEQFEYEKSKQKDTELNVFPKTENLNFFDLCDRGQIETNKLSDKIRSANETNSLKGNKDLTLVKKKVTSHYIPPDMVAIKILLEIFDKKGVGDLQNLTDEELIDLKNKLIEEVKNET